MELQQSPLYAKYIKSLGWIVEEINGEYVYIKKLLFLKSLLKIQRVSKLPSHKHLLRLVNRYNIGTIAIEPDSAISSSKLSSWLKLIPPNIKINTDYFLPTQTIRVSLKSSENEIFHSFSEAKRRAVRRAQKHGVLIEQSTDIHTFIKIKNKAAGFLGSITTYGLDKLWPNFTPKNASILLARNVAGRVVGGILLLYWNDLAYYWIAGATREGKKIFAPTLLIWEAIKLAKSHGSSELDFVGVWDPRLPNMNKQWLGFTKFKEGFGGYTISYPLSEPLRGVTK